MLDEYIKRQDKGVSYKEVLIYKGTPYNNQNFLLSNIYEETRLLASRVALRYNAMEDEIEVKETLNTPDEEVKLLTKSASIYVKINDNIFVFAPFEGDVEKGGYFQVLYEGERYDLFKKIVKNLLQQKKQLLQ